MCDPFVRLSFGLQRAGDVHKILGMHERNRMATMRVNFESCVHDSVDYGSDDQYMVSRVFLSIWCEGLEYTGLHADIKHPVDGDVETDLLEITLPQLYDSSNSPAGFRRAVGQYYRMLVGCSRVVIHTGNGNLRMRNHTFLLPSSFEFPLAGS